MYGKGQKRCVALILSFLLFFSMCITAVAATESTKREIEREEGKKIISVVYDDSHSMVRSGNWAYCNYAFQLFVSLCEGVEDFFVTYMSSAMVSSDLFNNTQNMQNIVDKIRGNFGVGGATPITSVETAYTKLKTVESTNVNDEYWLVIMSDGVFNSGKTESGATELSTCLNEYMADEMPNGTKVNTIYLSIGNSAAALSEYEQNQVYVERATNSEEIVSALVNIAKIIFGLVEVQNVNFADYRFLDDRTIEITTKLNLAQMIIITSKTNSIMSTARANVDQSQIGTETIHLNYPYREGIKTDTSLFGSKNSLVSDEIFPEGSYTVELSEPVTNENIQVLVRPDIELQLELYENKTGELITNFDTILESDRIDVHAKVVEISTGHVLTEDVLSNQYDYTLSVINGMDILYEAKEKILKDVGLKLEIVNVRGILSFDGNMLDATLIIKPIPHVIYEIKGVPMDNNVYSVENIVGKTTTCIFEVYGNETKLNRKELRELNLSFYPSKYDSLMKVSSVYKNDGTIVLEQKVGSEAFMYRLLFGWLSTWLISNDNISSQGVIYSPYQKEPIIGEAVTGLREGNALLRIWNYIQPFFMAILVIGYLFKKRFAYNMKISSCKLEKDRYEMVAYRYDWKSLRLNDTWISYIHKPVYMASLLPFVSNRITLQGTTILANSYFWSRKKRIKIKCRDKRIKAVKRVDTSTISTAEDLNLSYDSSRIKGDIKKWDNICIGQWEGVLFMYDKEAILYKFTL